MITLTSLPSKPQNETCTENTPIISPGRVSGCHRHRSCIASGRHSTCIIFREPFLFCASCSLFTLSTLLASTRDTPQHAQQSKSHRGDLFAYLGVVTASSPSPLPFASHPSPSAQDLRPGSPPSWHHGVRLRKFLRRRGPRQRPPRQRLPLPRRWGLH